MMQRITEIMLLSILALALASFAESEASLIQIEQEAGLKEYKECLSHNLELGDEACQELLTDEQLDLINERNE